MKIILGEAKKLELYENYADGLVARYCLLKYPHYACNWEFEGFDFNSEKDYELHNFAIFSLITNQHDDKAKKAIEICKENGLKMSAEPLTYGCLDEFNLPSEKMIEYLHKNFNNDPVWCYYVTAWCIIKNLCLNNKKYAEDHLSLAKRLNKKINVDNISLFIKFYKEYRISFESIGNDKILYRNNLLKNMEPTLDNACEMGCYFEDYLYYTYDYLHD